MMFTLFLSLLSLNYASESFPLGFELEVPAECDGLAVLDPSLTCPAGWMQYGTRQQDVMNCGMTRCGSSIRYWQSPGVPHTIDSCAAQCANQAGCVLFSFAPKCGDWNHWLTPVCTMHNGGDTMINDPHHGPNQIMCVPDFLVTPEPQIATTAAPSDPCPSPMVQYGLPHEDVKDCGMLNCASLDRFWSSRPTPDRSTWVRHTIQTCAQYCSNNGCAVFSFAEIGGDQNHPDDTVCTVHNSGDVFINSSHGPDQIMCRNPAVRPETEVAYAPGYGPSFLSMAMAQKNSIAFIGALSLIGGIGFALYKKNQRADYELVEENEALI